MKQFNLEEYLENPSRKVVTRNGRNARIISTDAMGQYFIIALVEAPNHTSETVYSYTKDGHFHAGEEHIYDLFFASEKHEGWVNVYRIGGLGCRCIFDSEEEARRNADESAIATVKIEWEE